MPRTNATRGVGKPRPVREKPDGRSVRARTRRRRKIEHVFLAGIPVQEELILELARMVDDEALAERLESCYRRDVKVMGLDVPERETILRALEAPPTGLEELRAVLLQEVEWRRREGI